MRWNWNRSGFVFDWKREFPMHEIGPVSVGFTDLTSLVERADVPTQYNCTA